MTTQPDSLQMLASFSFPNLVAFCKDPGSHKRKYQTSWRVLKEEYSYYCRINEIIIMLLNNNRTAFQIEISKPQMCN